MSKNKKKAWADHDVEDWSSYMAAKKGKLEEQFEDAAKREFQDATSLFSGVAIFVNGYTSPCADELKRLMMANGGVFHHYMRSRITTHIIASNLPYSKIVAYRKSQNPLPICKPEWITDSLNAQKLLDWRPYVLYSNCSKTQPSLQFAGKSSMPLLFAATVKSSESSISKLQESSVALGATAQVPPVTASTANINQASSSDRRSTTGPLCTKNAEFLSEFYNNSRLHHISTMGATFKDYVNELRMKNDGSFPGLERLKKLPQNVALRSSANNESDSEDDLFESPTLPESEKLGKHPVIMHIDMDCFFVSVGLRARPELKGFPVAVTHAKGNKQSNSKSDEVDSEEDYGSMSEVASCSYEARKAGVKNGMFLGQALKLCPNLKTIKYDFEGYKEVSYSLYNTVASYTLSIEAVSCDEMYADITAVLAQSQLSPMQFATSIRAEIKEKTGCPVSTGFGGNKLQARLATRKAKPDGQFYLESSQVQGYIGSMVVRDLPGVGSSTMQLLNKMNIHTCADLQNVSLGLLQKEFGKKTGEMLHNMCRGTDNSKLNVEHVRKSVSCEVNYGIRFETPADADVFLRQLSQEVSSRLQKANAKGRSVTLKLMVRAKDAPKEAIKFMGHGVCDNFTKSKNLIAPIDDTAIITKEVLSLWNQMQQLPEDIRGIGIQISRLEQLKTRTGGANMMNFICKAKQTDSEIVTSKTSNRESIQSSTNSIKPNIFGDEKIDATKNVQLPEPKPRGLKAFLVPKERIPPDRNGSVGRIDSASSRTPNIEEIDESVLAQLPADIRMEILKSRGDNRISSCADPKPSTSTAPDEVTDNRAAASCAQGAALNSEERNFDPRIVSSSDEVSSMQDIDESVLAQLPADIRMEILKSRGEDRISSCAAPKPSTSTAPDIVKDNHLAASSRKTEEKRNTPGLKPRIVSPTVEVSPMQDIDESVLAQLPADIRMEILKSRGENRISSCAAPKPSTSTAPDIVKDNHLAASSRKTEEKRKSPELKPRIVSPTVEVSPMQNIDESVLKELPEDIRNEILGAKNSVSVTSRKTLKKSSKSRQTQQETYFKHTKSSSGKSGKSSMPPIEEIDMSVLIELPEDIRNEIINEYKANKLAREKDSKLDNNEAIESGEANSKKPTEMLENRRNNGKEQIEDEANMSFSQVDPEFLAALSEDMKTDVQMYCMAKKKASLSKIKKTDSNTAVKPLAKNKNSSKPSKTNSRLVKPRNKSAATIAKGNSNVRRTTKQSPELARTMEAIKVSESEKRTNGNERPSARFLVNELIVDREASESQKQREEIISHHSSFIGNQAKSDEQEMLSNLVNYLFTLPTRQVKMQIQTWISNSDVVNEIDLLSLATFLSMLPKKKRLEDLHILLKTMHRCITKTGSCVWHETYRRTVVHVQRYMQIEYKSNLMLPRIECDLCECKSNHC